MEGLPSHVTPVAWREVRYDESFVDRLGTIGRWLCKEQSSAKYLIVDVRPRRVLVVPEHELPQKFDYLCVGYYDADDNYVKVPYTIEERRD